MAKVYCKECEYYWENVAWRHLVPTQYLCKDETSWKDTPLESVKHYADCLIKNKVNDCSDFKIKRNWRGKPMWNQDWGRSRVPNCPCPPPPPKRKSKEILEGDRE